MFLGPLGYITITGVPAGGSRCFSHPTSALERRPYYIHFTETKSEDLTFSRDSPSGICRFPPLYRAIWHQNLWPHVEK